MITVLNRNTLIPGGVIVEVSEHFWLQIGSLLGASTAAFLAIKSIFDLRQTHEKTVADEKKNALQAAIDEDSEMNRRLDSLLRRTEMLESQRDKDLQEKAQLRTEKHELTARLDEAIHESKRAREESEHLRVNMATMSMEIMAANTARAELQHQIECLSCKLDEALKANDHLAKSLDDALQANRNLMAKLGG